MICIFATDPHENMLFQGPTQRQRFQCALKENIYSKFDPHFSLLFKQQQSQIYKLVVRHSVVRYKIVDLRFFNSESITLHIIMYSTLNNQIYFYAAGSCTVLSCTLCRPMDVCMLSMKPRQIVDMVIHFLNQFNLERLKNAESAWRPEWVNTFRPEDNFTNAF